MKEVNHSVEHMFAQLHSYHIVGGGVCSAQTGKGEPPNSLDCLHLRSFKLTSLPIGLQNVVYLSV